MLLAGTIIVLLILLTALYVAAEFAAVGIRRSRLRRLAEDGNVLAARLLPVVEDPAELDRYIAVSQIGITLSSLILGAYGQAALAPVVAPVLQRLGGMDPETAQSTAAGGVLLILTILAVIIGELVPKSLALQDPTRTGLATVLPMQWSGRLFGPFITFLNGSGILILRLLRVPATGHRHVHSPEEIELLIAESRDGGFLEPEEQVRLHRALRLGLRTASQLMVARERLAGVDSRVAAPDILRIVSTSPYSRLPVFEGAPDNMVGVLHTKDIVTAFVGQGRLSIATLLRPLVRVRADLPADELLAFLRQERTHQAFVVTAENKVLGLVTLEDVVAELLGGVADEFKGARRRLRLPDRAAAMIEFAIITGLILLNGVFVAAEFAIVGAPRASIDRRAAEGNALARSVQAVLRDPKKQDRYIATAQLGITVASLGLGMYGEHVLAEAIYHVVDEAGLPAWLASHTIASILAVTILTYFHIVVGEMVPKSLALQRAETMALWITPPMLWMKNLLFPAIVALNGIGNFLLGMMGVHRQVSHAERYYTPEELQIIVQESEELGALRSESSQMLQELFEFGDLTAGQVMVPRVRIVGIELGATPEEIRALLAQEPHTRYPIFEEDLDHIVGMIHIKDLLRLLLNDETVAAEHARPLPLMPETAELDNVLDTMRREGTQMVVILDEHGGTAGVVTLEDLFEEVVGEIAEGPTDLPPTYHDVQGRLRVPGTMRVEEVGQQFDLDLEHEDVDSVSGLVLTLLGRPPLVGDVVRYGRLGFEVTAVKGHGVDECAVTLRADTET